MLLSSLFPFTTSDSTNCAFTTIKVFDGSTEKYSGDYSTGTFTFPSNSKGSISYQIFAYTAGGGTNKVEGTLNIHICGAETVGASKEYMFLTYPQNSAASSPTELPYSDWSTFFSVSGATNAACKLNLIELKDSRSASLSDARFSVATSSNGDGQKSMYIDVTSAFAEFSFKLKAISVGGSSAEINVKALVRTPGASCTYSSTPASVTHAIAAPITTTVDIAPNAKVTFSSSDPGEKACPLN